jgi:hypothetical protein
MRKIFFALIILVAGCGSTTTIVDSYKAPDATYTPGEFQKVAVIAVLKDEGARKAVEDKLVTYNKAFHVSYPMFSRQQELADSLKIVSQLKNEGFDAVLVMRLVGKIPSTKYAQGGYNQAYVQNGIFYYTDYLNKGAYVTDMDYLVSTSLYSFKHNKLMWSGISKTTNPKKIDDLINGVAKEVANQMVLDKFIPTK